MNIKLFLLLLSGLCWTIVYIDSIRVGFRDKSYAMPFWALSLNIAWEFLHFAYGLKNAGTSPQTIVNGIWAGFDIVLLVTYFKFGKSFFPMFLHAKWFIPYSIAVLAACFVIQFFFIDEFGVAYGATYSAFLQNLLMSVLFINMFVLRKGSSGQSLTIAICKWIGTLAPVITFGILGHDSLKGPSNLVLAVGAFIFIADLVYILMLVKDKNTAK